MEKKHFFFTRTRLEPNYGYPKKCVNCNKSEFATKQHKCIYNNLNGLVEMKDCVKWMENGGIVSKIRLPHIYRGNKCASNKNVTSLLSKS